MEARSYKDGELVGRSEVHKIIEMDVEGLPHLELFHMPLVKLERLCLFEHMAGKPLSSFFNNGGLEIEERKLEPVYFVHGRSEAIRGRTTVSAVVLAYPHGTIDRAAFMLKTPEIYKRFATLL
jgi:hypothetical protein